MDYQEFGWALLRAAAPDVLAALLLVLTGALVVWALLDRAFRS